MFALEQFRKCSLIFLSVQFPLHWFSSRMQSLISTYASSNFSKILEYIRYSSSVNSFGSYLACSYKSQNWWIVRWPTPLTGAAKVFSKYALRFSEGCLVKVLSFLVISVSVNKNGSSVRFREENDKANATPKILICVKENKMVTL